MTTVPLFVELCAGTAALSLRLHKDGARPPVSRMGAKTGYADAILRVLGLHPGQRADRYLWCEPDPGVRLLLHAYRDSELAKAAAAIIRGWAAEVPRALWERLRAEGPPRLPDGEVDAGEVARWVTLWSWHYRQGDYSSGGPVLPGDRRQDATATATGLSRTPALPATIAPDAREVDPREVARWAALQDMSLNGKGVAAGLGALMTPVGTAAWSRHARGEAVNWKQCHGPGPLLPKVEAMPHLAAALIHPDARDIDPPALPPGTVVYMDPSYVGTTGYADNLSRPEVVALARRWAEAGATVAISEAEPIPELVAEGWYSVEITGERIGQKRTFSKQQREWLTINRAPAWTPPIQNCLFQQARK